MKKFTKLIAEKITKNWPVKILAIVLAAFVVVLLNI